MGGFAEDPGGRGMDFGRITRGQVISRDAAPWADGADYGVMKVIVYLQVRSCWMAARGTHSTPQQTALSTLRSSRSAVTSAGADARLQSTGPVDCGSQCERSSVAKH